MSESAPQSRFAAHEAQADEAIANNAREALTNAHSEALAENAAREADAARLVAEKQAQALERKQNSKRVRDLNDRAELEIFGSRGRTYTKNTRNMEVIADATNKIEGKVDQIGGDRSISTKEGEREQVARNYLKNIEVLVEGGMELTQAKLFMDLREERRDSNARLFNKLVKHSITEMSKEEAMAHAAQRVTSKNLANGETDDFTAKVIAEKGLYSRREYDTFKKSDEYKNMLNAYKLELKAEADAANKQAWEREQTEKKAAATDGAAGVEVPTAEAADTDNNRSQDTPTAESSADDLQQNQELRQEEMERLDTYRNEYLRRVAGRARRTLTLKDFGKKGVEEARQDYENMLNDIFASEISHLQELDLPQTDIDQIQACFAFGEQRKLAKELHKLRLEATGNYKIVEQTRTAENGQVAAWTDLEATKRGPLNKFYEWFGRVNVGGKTFSKGGLKKAGAMGAIGFGTGAVVGLVAAPLTAGAIAGIGGGVLISRVTKAYMSTHIRKRSEEANDMHAAFRRDELLNALGDGTNGASMTNLIGNQTKTEVTRNRRRTGVGIGAAALGGALGAAAAEAIGLADAVDFAPVDIDMPDIDMPTIGDLAIPPFPSFNSLHIDNPFNNDNVADLSGGNGTSGTGHNGNGNNHGGDHAKNHEFDKHDVVEAGHGYTQELQDMFAAKGVNLTPEQSYSFYQHLDDKFPGLHGDYFTGDSGYQMANGDYGISVQGNATWRPQVLAEINRYAQEQELLK